MGLDICLCGILVRLLIFWFFFSLVVFLSTGNMRHLIVEALIARNLMESFFKIIFWYIIGHVKDEYDPALDTYKMKGN